jgi:di/tricarboxylate transporter
MSLPVLSICALVLAVVLSVVSQVNVGLVALLLAYLVGAGAGGLRPAQIAAGFPAHMFITVVALALLFEQARRNGTLDRLAALTLRLCRGNAGLVAPLFFALAALIGSLGAGNIGAVALLAPLGMSVAGEVGISPFLMALLIAMGGNAAALSPLAPAFLPMVPGLSAKLGVDPLAIASSIGVGAHLVDVSPLSTLGALCLANAPQGADRGRLYRQLLA